MIRKPGLMAWLALALVASPVKNEAQEKPPIQIESIEPNAKLVYDLKTGVATATNGVKIVYGDAMLTARKVTLDQQTGDAIAEGEVYLQRGKEVWGGDRIRYNFTSKEIAADKFKAGMAPFMVEGEGLSADQTKQIFTATNSFVTTDDLADPGYRVRARSIRVVPGRYIEARDATLYLGEVPVFYYPYYRRNLGRHPNNWVLTPGYRSRYGPYLLGTYNWYFSDYFAAAFHVDYRERRGVGFGPDFVYDAGKLGKGDFRSYYTHDNDPSAGGQTNVTTRSDRYRINFSHEVNLRTNLTAKVVVREQSDAYVIRDF
ncbi:MAG: hypothetical protein ABI651_02620, partial [Verrucomicrobiota bacterium]